jgi:hypothetical protein
MDQVRARAGSRSERNRWFAQSLIEGGGEPEGFCVPKIRTIAKYLGAYSAGVVTVGFFLSGPVERPADNPPNAEANGGWVLIPPAITVTEPWTNGTAETPAVEPPEQSSPPAIVTDQRNVETTGSSTRETADHPDRGRIEATPRRGESCNVSLCRRYYRSFDEATCTYRPYGGGPPELCRR